MASLAEQQLVECCAKHSAECFYINLNSIFPKVLRFLSSERGGSNGKAAFEVNYAASRTTEITHRTGQISSQTKLSVHRWPFFKINRVYWWQKKRVFWVQIRNGKSCFARKPISYLDSTTTAERLPNETGTGQTSNNETASRTGWQSTTPQATKHARERPLRIRHTRQVLWCQNLKALCRMIFSVQSVSVCSPFQHSSASWAFIPGKKQTRKANRIWQDLHHWRCKWFEGS